MHQITLRCVAALVLLAPGAAMAQTGDLSGRLLACRAIGEVTARAACYDRLVDGLAPSPSTVPAAPPRPVTQAPPSPIVGTPPPALAAPRLAPPPAPASRFGADDLPVQKRDPGAPPVPDQIIAKATAVRIDASGFAIVTLDNGQTWRQTEGPELRVLPGAEVKIRTALMGSYLMSLASGNRSVRAKRIN